MKKSTKRVVGAALAAVMICTSAPSVQINGLLPPLAVSTQAAETITVKSAQGWKESAWVEWGFDTSNKNIAGFAVSYSKDGSNFTSIDDNLIRRYNDGRFRADIIGLAKGTYTVKIEAKNSSNGVVASKTAQVTVEEHDRTGFAFSPKSRFDTSSNACGAYNADGTPKSGAEIIYITSKDDIDTVTSDGVTGLSNILQARDKRSTKPLIVRFIGKIEYSGSQLNSSGYIQVKPSKAYTNSNITIEGVGADAAVNFGFLLRYAGNVEIRNLAIHDFGDDGISLDTKNSDIWIHNNEIFYGVQGSGDKAKGDGATDVKNDSQYVTISYNHYWDGGKCSLCGMKGEGGDNFISYHHNWFDHSDSRHPRIRTMSVHVYNNYYDGNAKYGVGASEGSSAFVEGNYFRNCKYPTLQGSVGRDSDGSGGSLTLEDSNPVGAVKWYNNTIEDTIKDSDRLAWSLDHPGETAGNGDACKASFRNQDINYTTEARAKYNNFDINDSYVQGLASKIQSPADAKDTVTQYAGRTGGGDFKKAASFEFTRGVEDDKDHEINQTLRTKLTNYYKNDSISSEYVIASIGGAVNSSFTPEQPQTQATTEAQTETTTEAPTETTTSAPVDPMGGVKESFNDGYSFGGSGTLTQDSSYGGAYFTITGAAVGNGTNTVVIGGGAAAVNDSDTGATTNLVLPIPTYTSGKVTISGSVKPSTTSSGWTLMQVWGAGDEIVGVRTDGGKYGIRINKGTTVTTTGTAITTDKTAYTLVLDFDNHKANLTVGGKSTGDVDMTGTTADTIKFVTATASRNITVYPITVTSEGGSTIVKGDINLDGRVDAADVSLALQYIVGGVSLSADRIAMGDMNNDGRLTIVDAYMIKKQANQ